MSDPRLLPALALATLVACTAGKGGDDDDGPPGPQGDDSGGETADGGSASDGGTDGLPPKPDPFTLRITGGANLTLPFDTPTCSHPVGSSNFRAFWRDSTGAHTFVLVADLLGSFTGPGSYDTATAGAKVKLQEEAGGSGGHQYYATDEGAGDSATITVDHIDAEKLEVAWGEFSFTSLHGTSGPALTAEPQPIPIWCDSLN